MNTFKLVFLVTLAMLAFAANSLFNRMALSLTLIDPASFAMIRIVSGAAILLVVLVAKRQSLASLNIRVLPSVFLFIYVICFSYAYVQLSTGIGALILFSVVQLVLVVNGFIKKQSLSAVQWFGFLIAFVGFLLLVAPSDTGLNSAGIALMVFAGLGWGGYTILGSGSKKPLVDTAVNFILCVPLVVIFGAAFNPNAYYSVQGIMYGVASGVLASAAGYAVWYAVLPFLKSSQAGVIQLSVPVLATAMGVIFVNETLTVNTSLLGLMIFLGIILNILNPKLPFLKK